MQPSVSMRLRIIHAHCVLSPAHTNTACDRYSLCLNHPNHLNYTYWAIYSSICIAFFQTHCINNKTSFFQITEQISNSNDDLEKEIEDLKQQKQQLEEMLQRHSCKKEQTHGKPCEENKENNGHDEQSSNSQ